MARRIALSLAAAALALLTAASALAQPDTAPASALRSYLAAVHQPVRQASAAGSYVASGLFFADRATATVTDDPIDSARAARLLNQGVQQLQIALASLSAVSAPRDLRGPQASLRSGITLTSRAAASLSAALTKSDVVDAGVAYALAQGKVADAADRIGEWRDELIVQLRRRGITVPLWVKQAGR